jgi:hypothetical protein
MADIEAEARAREMLQTKRGIGMTPPFYAETASTKGDPSWPYWIVRNTHCNSLGCFLPKEYAERVAAAMNKVSAEMEKDARRIAARTAKEIKLFHLIKLPDKPSGYVNISNSSDWEVWIRNCLPAGLHQEVQRRLISNLKHVLVGLEMKAALIVPHAKRGNGPSILFEPYFHILNFEFCVGMFSICEGLGSALWLRENKLDGSAANLIAIEQWKSSLAKKFDPEAKLGLDADVGSVKGVRDKLHQDRLGARESIDWHAFSYDEAFTPAARAVRCLLGTNTSDVPKATNLTAV